MYCKKLFLALSCVCAVLTTSQIFADTYIVDPAGTYKTIQSAYTAAAGSGDTILLTAGYTYTGSGNINLTFAKDFTLGRTGVGANPIIDMEGSGKFCTIDSICTVTMSNLKIQNGGGDNLGGAIRNNGILYALSCTFNDNSSLDGGGAIFNHGVAIGSGIVNITGCIFSDNHTDFYGGAIANFGEATDSGILNATNCSFSNNNADDSGGAIFNAGDTADNGILNATGCVFDGNTSSVWGGALYNGLDGTAVLGFCRFVDNFAITSADAIYNDSAGTVSATNCWWGTNIPNRTALFDDTLEISDYSPYIVLNLLPEPLWPRLSCASPITADFTQNSSGDSHGCTIMDGTPIIFSTNSLDVTVSPTLTYVVNGQAHTALYDIPNTDTFSVCAKTDTDLSAGYTYCETATPTDLTEVYVSALDGDDANLGNSPANPVKTIQGGLDRLSCVSTGTLYLYLEEGNTFTGAGNKDLIITKPNLVIAPYNGTHGPADPIIDMEGSGRFCMIDSISTITISTLKIQNGNADIGGAIHSDKATCNITDCTFSNNSADGGGAISIIAGILNASGCTFNGNTANMGGAIFSKGSSCFINCSRFIDNTTTTNGDAIFMTSDSTVTATNCWWGTNYPAWNDLIYNEDGTVTYTPYIILNLLPEQLWPRIGCASPITADFTQNSSGDSHGCTIMNDTPVIFSTNSLDATISPTLAYVVNGQAQTTLYDIPNTDTFSVCAKTDTDLSTTGYTYCETATPIDLTEVYVSALDGDDANLGDSSSNPVKTIQGGLDRLSCVSTGTLYLYLEEGNTFTGADNKNLIITKTNLVITSYFGEHGSENPIIDMEGSGRFCTIDSISTVTMSNLKIQNGNADIDNVGTILNNGTLSAFSCTFSNNEAYYGGAIYSAGPLNITECIFSNNQAADFGGAIYNQRTCNAILCIFSNNYAEDASGGAIYNYSATENSGVLNATNCMFSNNNADGPGGAIYNFGRATNSGIVNVTECTFNNNYTTKDGGAIYNSGSLQATGCTFAGNESSESGGALGNRLGAYLGTAVLECCRFVDNFAIESADAIYNAVGTVSASNCWWGTNYPKATTLFGGTAVTYEPYIFLNLLPEPLWPRLMCASPVTADFTQNSSGDSHGCTIMNGTPVIFSTNSLDVTVSPTLAYVIDGQAQTTLYDIPNTDTFSVCAKTDTDISIGYTYCETATPTDLTEVYVSALDGDDANLGDEDHPVKTIQRGLNRLSCVSTSTVYLYLEQGNTFTGTGNKDLTITKTNLIITSYNGTHGPDDPIIDMEGAGRFCTIDTICTVTMSNLNIKNGFVTGSEDSGGAILNNGTLATFSCTFSNNSANESGGVIFNRGDATGGGILNTSNCTFSNNSALFAGGAIASSGIFGGSGILNVTNCTFNNNNAQGSQVGLGGAIANGLSETGSSIMNITGCTFSNNSARDEGGALFNDDTCVATCCRFVGNTANNGNAIYNDEGTATAINCWWGTNIPDRTDLFADTLEVGDYEPYIIINLLPDPLFIPIGIPTPVTADFTHNSDGTLNGCTIMDGTPVIFSSSAAVIITPTLTCFVDGLATTTVLDNDVTGTFTFCAETDTDISAGYSYCETVTPAAGLTAVYVSDLDGDDNNLGDTPDNPVKTIQTGLNRLSIVSTNTLYIYLEQGNIFAGANNKDLTITKTNLVVETYEHAHGSAAPIIDMEGSGRFCTIDAICTVTMSKLKLQNGYNDDARGGAVVNNGILYTVSCTFSNNSAHYMGGAIYNSSGILNATNCTFNNNSAHYDGGAIGDEEGTSNATECLFNNNNAEYGGAISSYGELQTTKCTFSNNNATSGGGAIDNEEGILNATECIFNNNNADAGGAIDNYSELQATGCTFSNNNASYGGAIGNSNTSVLTCCRFVNNTATYGNAIYNDEGTVTATNCWWGTNIPSQTDLFANTLEVGDYSPYIIINLLPDPLFIPVGIPTPVTADFTHNNIGSSHGCTIMNGTPVTFSSSADVGITPTLTYFVDGLATTTVVDNDVTGTFTFCAETDTDISTGYSYCETVTPAAGLTAVYVSALDGDDNNLGDTPDNPVKTIQIGLNRLSIVSTNTLYIYLEQGNTFAGANNKDLIITKTNLVVTSYFGVHGSDNPIIDMEGSGRFCTIDAICTVTMNNLDIRHGYKTGFNPEDGGGAILNNGTLAAFSCSFSGNYAQYVGGAIENYGNLKATECSFSNNNADIAGGAIYSQSSSVLNATNCTFNNNRAYSEGGSICSYGELQATGCTFINNNTGYGGAICSYGELQTIGCSFNNNNAESGGAIVNEEGTLNTTECTFSNNSAESGGAIVNMEATTTVNSCLFINNRATAQEEAYGGAIYTSIFQDKKNGGAYQPSHTVYVYNSTFIGNSALYNGGALANLDDAAYLTGCTFQLNYAPQGGAVANTSNIATALLNGQSCTFIENSADLGGALFNEGTDAYATINCCRFVNNTATSSGDAIYNEGDLVTSPTVDAEDNWWGSNADPATAPNLLYGAIDADPWTTVTLTAIPLEGKGNFTIVATFSSCVPDGTPVAFSTTEGTITPSSSVISGGTATATLTDALYTVTVCILVGPEDEQFSVCIIVQGPIPDYQFLPTSIDISTGARAIYALDWCQQQPGTLQPPLLAAGGVIDSTSCAKPNIFVYCLNNICQSNENGPIDPRIMTITEQQFDSAVVNAVAWCCNDAICPAFPFLAVGGNTDNGTNTRVYTIDPRTYSLDSYAPAPDNGLSSVTAVAWNPETSCKFLTVGGCQEEGICNVIAYRNLEGNLIAIDSTLFDSNITSLDWCKTNTLPANMCAYLAVGATGTDSCEGGLDTINQIAIYKGIFKESSPHANPCGR